MTGMRPDHHHPEARLDRVAFADVPGWCGDAVDEAWLAFLTSARAVFGRYPSLREARPTPDCLAPVMAAALDTPCDSARLFFETRFVPYRIASEGFVTAYYEPCVEGALECSDAFTAPILARPRDLGSQDPYPDRAAIRAGAIDAKTRPVVWLRDAVEVFFIQVQGSARVRLPDGSALRLVYDGRNGLSYTSIGGLAIESGAIAPDAMALDVLKDWLRANGAGTGGPADTLMNRNASYVFFRADPLLDAQAGPIGGQGLPLTPFRSIAIDRSIWPYGLPFFVGADLADGPFRHLMIAQDTGSAIVGPARADLFLGSGDAAGRRAGLVRHAADLVVLLPDGVRL